MVFPDRSRATLEPNSQIKVEAGAAALLLRILKGGVKLYQAEGSSISLIENNPAAGSQAYRSIRAQTLFLDVPSGTASAVAIRGARVPQPRSKKCPEPLRDDPRDQNCGKGNDGKI
jgi:hypothetical protein